MRQRTLVAILAVAAIHALAGFLVAPLLVKSQLERRLSELFQRPVAATGVRFNPYTLAVRTGGVSVGERDGAAGFGGWESAVASLRWSSLWSGEWRFESVAFVRPGLRITARPDGELNVSDLLAASAGESTTRAAGGRPVRIARVSIVDARVEFRDERSEHGGMAAALGPLTMEFSPGQLAGGEGKPYSFETKTESGATLGWTGTVRAAPLEISGEVGLSAVSLARHLPEIAGGEIAVTDGFMNLGGRLEIGLDATGWRAVFRDGTATATGVKLRERGAELPMAEMAEVRLRGLEADLLTQESRLEDVEITGGVLAVQRVGDGGWNVRRLVDALPIRGFRWTEFSGAIVDGSAEIEFADGSLSVREPGPDANGSAPFEVSFALGSGGRVKAEGGMHAGSFDIDARLEVDAIDAVPLARYAGDFPGARVSEGRVSFGGRLRTTGAESGDVRIGLEGQAWLERFRFVDPENGREFAGFSDLVFGGLTFSSGERAQFSAESANLVNPFLRLEVERDGKLATSGVFRGRVARQDDRDVLGFEAGARTGTDPLIEFGRTVVTDGEVSFVDRSARPEVSLVARAIGGAFSDFSNRGSGKGQVDLKGKLGGTAPIFVLGRADLFAGPVFADLRVTASSVPLRLFDSYARRFAGHDIDNGTGSIEMTLRVEGRAIQARADVNLHELEFGAATNSRDATSLPVKFGTRLVRDRSGRISLGLAVDGGLDDPGFSVARQAMKPVREILERAAESPLAVLTGLPVEEAEQLSSVGFSAGSVVLGGEANSSLELLARGLREHPGASMEVAGGFDETSDGEVVRRGKFDAMIRKAAAEQLRKEFPEAPTGDIGMTPELYAATVKRIFDLRFPPGSELGTPLPVPPMILGMPSKDEAGWFQRLIDWITFKNAREEAAFRAEQEKAQEEFLKAAQAAVDAGLPLEVMEARLGATVQVDSGELQALADERAAAVRDYLVGTAGISRDRVTITATRERGARATLRVR